MRNLKVGIALFSVTAVVLILTLERDATAKPGSPNPLEVTVTNTPLPIAGSVSVANFPAPPTVNQFRQRVNTFGQPNDIIVSNTTSSTLIIENIAVSDSFTTGAVFVGVNSHPAPGVTQFEGTVTVPVAFVAGTTETSAGNLQTKIVVKPGEDLEIQTVFQSVIMLTGHYEP